LLSQDAIHLWVDQHSPCQAKVTRLHSKKTRAERIADAIVALVERTNGPVFLHEIDQEIAGFKVTGKKGYIHFIQRNGKETVFWAGMTKCGFEALRSVLNNRRVAVQFVSSFPYVFDGVCVDLDSWQPIALVPVRAANLSTSKWDMRVSGANRAAALASGTVQVRPLTPQPIRFTADQFAVF
jgi:hypothetical protein